MSMLRPVGWLFFVLLAIVAGMAVFLLTFDANRYKSDIVTLVKQQTGRTLVIDGGISLSLYPDIALKIEQAKLGNNPDFAGKSFAEARSARIAVQLLPLLNQELRVNEVTLQGLNLYLQRDKNSKINWSDLFPKNSARQDNEAGQVVAQLLGNFMVAGVSVEDSAIHWIDDLSGQNMTIAPLNLHTGMLRPGEPVDITLATRLQQNVPALDISVDGATTATLADNKEDFTLSDFKLKVQANNQPGVGDTLNATFTGDVAGSLQSKVVNVSGLVAAIDLASKAQGNIHADVKGTLRGETVAQKYFIPDLQAQIQLPQLGNAQLVGRMQADLAKQDISVAGMRVQANLKHPQAGQIDGTLGGDAHLDLASQLLKIDGMQVQVKMQGGTLPVQTVDAQANGSTRIQLAQQQLNIGGLQLTANVQSDSIPGGSLKQQSKGEVQLNWGNGKGVIDLVQTTLSAMGQQLNGSLQIRDPIAALAMDGEFKANSLSYPPFQLQNATLGVRMQDGIVTLVPKGTLFKGAYQGDIRIDTNQTPATLNMTHKTDALRTEELFYALTEDKTVTGALDLDAKLTTVAGDAAAFKQNLNGTVDVALQDGTIRDANFAQKIKQVVKLFEQENTNDLGEKEVAFTTLGGQWQVRQGVFHTDDNVMTAPHFQVKGAGDVNIVNESLDFKLRISEKPKPDKPEGLFAPLHIHGPWDNLSYGLELDVLLKALAKRELDEEKAKLQEKLQAEKQKQLDALKQKADEEKARLQQQLQNEKDKLQQRLQDQLQKQLGGSSSDGQQQDAGSAEDQLKQKLEDELKNKLKGLF